MSKSLTDRTLSGISWNFVKIYGKTIINILVGIVLARLIPPEEFGLIGMTIVFTGLADLFATMGMGASIIKYRELNDNHIRVATTFTVCLGLLVFVIFWFSAPLISNFYDEDRLTLILRVLAIIFIIKGLNSVSYSLIIKKIDFKTILKIELSGFIFGYSIISITLALLGYGVWSLVWGRLASSIISAVFTLYNIPLLVKPLFRKKEFKELFSFGAGVSLSKFINYIATNIDYLIIGKFLTPLSLGLYQRSYNLMTLPIINVSSGIYNVLFPAFSEVQNDVEKLQRGYLRTLQTVVFLLFPVLTAMMICGDYVILGLYGPNWYGAIDVFKILVVAGFFRTTLSYSGALAHATGKIYYEVLQQIMYVVILTAGVLWGVNYGIEGVAIAVIIALFSLFLAQSYLAISIIKINWSIFFRALLPGINISVIIGGIDLIFVSLIENYLYFLPDPVKLLIMMVITGIIFIACIIFLPDFFKGDTIIWLIKKYERSVPLKLKKIYLKFN